MGPKSSKWKVAGYWILAILFLAAAQTFMTAGIYQKMFFPKVAVTQMFEQNGCTGYTFKDNGADQYFVKCRCGAEIKWSNGKVGVVACTQVVDPKQDLRQGGELVLPAPPEPAKEHKKK